MKSTSSKTEILFISSYPGKDSIHDEKTVGVASYTKNLVRSIENTFSVTVFAEYEDKPCAYREQSVEVKRIWQRGNPLSWIETFRAAGRGKYGKAVIPFEVNMPGGPVSKLAFLAGFLALRLSNKKIITIMHQAVVSPEDLADTPLAAPFLKAGVAILHWYLESVSERIIVFEEELKRAFSGQKAIMIPHAVEEFASVPPQKEARLKLGLPDEPLVLYFGYISPYKGIRDLVERHEEKNDYRLVVAGGANPNHRANRGYMEYVETTMDLARRKNIPVLGFVKEEDIPAVFSAADLVVLPYRTFFSSSGPLSLAFSFGKPVLLSRPLEKYFVSNDFNLCLAKEGLSKEDLLFDPANGNAGQRIAEALRQRQKLSGFSCAMAAERSWEHVGKLFAQVIGSDA